jgi:hypothetical protein
MNSSDQDWTLVDSAVEVTSLLDDPLSPSGSSESVYECSFPGTDPEGMPNFAREMVTILVLELIIEIIRLRRVSAELIQRFQAVSTSHGPFGYVEFLKYLFEWLLSLTPLTLMKESGLSEIENNTERVIMSRSCDHRTEMSSLVSLASQPLRAGRFVGSLFRPDILTFSATKRFRERSSWSGLF